MRQYKDNARLMSAYADLNAGRHDEARAALDALAAAGEQRAFLYLGWIHERGLGTNIDEARAAACYLQLCDEGDADACFYAGSLNFRRRRMAEALNLYVRAAKAGHPSAAYWASAIYGGEGNTVVQPALADEYLRLAAANGHVFAKRDLAKQLMTETRSPFGKISAATKYASAILRGIALLARNADDPRVR